MARLRSMFTSLVLLFLLRVVEGANFTACLDNVIAQLPNNSSVPLVNNATIEGGPWPDPIYHGKIFGFHLNDSQRPLTLTYEGCLNVCGPKPQYNAIGSAFEILTTWVLPVIALLSSFPYESNSKMKSFEAFANWIGSPAAALTTTVWNLLMIRRCQKLSEERDQDTQAISRDSLFILSCVNQYIYERRERSPKSPMMSYTDVDRQRDKALIRGVLFPFLDHRLLAPGRPLRTKLENITHHLAFQLRLQRKKGVYPIVISIVWFLLAFIVSIVTAFAQLGDNTTAHSLALGLLLSWLPILVVATVVDRNPVSTTRCGILIERWLWSVDAFFAEAGLAGQPSADRNSPKTSVEEPLLDAASPPAVQQQFISRRPVGGAPLLVVSSHDGKGDGRSIAYAMEDFSKRRPSIESSTTDRPSARSRSGSASIAPSTTTIRAQQWRQDSYMDPFRIQDFVGQGRRLRYCAVTDTVLDLFKDPKFNMELPGNEEAYEFKRRLTKRPFSWYVTWFVCQMVVSMSFAMAFLVSFHTPTIGLGCRSLSYFIWWILSSFSWVVIGIFQEPPRVVRWAALFCDVLAFGALFTLMVFQLTGGLNRCICKCSLFGSSKYGGYMDFENGEFYHRAYDVRRIWGVATAFGLVSCSGMIFWLYYRWWKDSLLWKYDEDAEPDLDPDVDLHWLT